MKQVLIAMFAGGVLAACGSTGGNADAKLRADCAQVMTDPEAVGFMADLGTDADGLCGCMASLVAAGTDEQKLQSYAAFDAIATEMEESGKAVEDIVNALEDGGGESAVSDPQRQTLLAGLQQVEYNFERIGKGFGDNGTCPVG